MNDGGPAFPTSSKLPGVNNTNGMSLRDWFAGQALAGMQWNLSDNWRASTFEKLSEIAYAIADALLLKRLEPRDLRDAPGRKQQ